MPKYTPDQVYSEIRRQGMTPFQSTVFLAIAWRESQGTFDTDIHNGNWRTLDDSWGIYQINFFGGIHRDTTQQCARDLQCSTAYAIKLYKSAGNRWKDWYVYSDAQAALLPNWNDAKKVSDKMEASGAFPTGNNIQGPGADGQPTTTSPGSVYIPGIGSVDLPFNPNDPTSGLPGVGDITSMLKDTIQFGIWLLIGLTCIIIGIWGVVNDTEAGKQMISGAKKVAGTAAKAAVLV